MPLPDLGMDVYLGVDGGAVGGPSSGLLIGKRLAGAVAGLRGNYRMLRYEVFIGTPISKPDGFQTARTSAGFEISASF
jgi:hemolysin activation/secretion protein